MSNDSVEKEQSLDNLGGGPESEEMKGEEAQEGISGGQLAKSDGDPTSQKPMPRPEDYDFFLNVRRREQNEPSENDEPTEH